MFSRLSSFYPLWYRVKAYWQGICHSKDEESLPLAHVYEHRRYSRVEQVANSFPETYLHVLIVRRNMLDLAIYWERRKRWNTFSRHFHSLYWCLSSPALLHKSQASLLNRGEIFRKTVGLFVNATVWTRHRKIFKVSSKSWRSRAHFILWLSFRGTYCLVGSITPALWHPYIQWICLYNVWNVWLGV